MDEKAKDKLRGYVLGEQAKRHWAGRLYTGLDRQRKRPVEVLTIEKGGLSCTGQAWQEFSSNLEGLLLLQHPSLVGYREVVRISAEQVALVVEQEATWEEFGRVLEAHPAGLPEQQVLELVRQLTEGLQQLAHQNITHGALTPDALWFDADTNKLRIAWFGLAPLVSAPFPDALRPFVAPEWHEHAGLHDPTQDIYALGVLCWLMLTGSAAIPAVEHLRTAEVKSAPARLPQLSTPTRQLLQKTLPRDPDKRAQRYLALLRLLDQKSGSSDTNPASGATSPMSQTLSYEEEHPPTTSKRAPESTPSDSALQEGPFVTPSRAGAPFPFADHPAPDTPDDPSFQPQQRPWQGPFDDVALFGTQAPPQGHPAKSLAPKREHPLPELVPEGWEWETIRRDDKFNHSFRGLRWLWLFLLLALSFLAYCTYKT